MTLDDNVKNLYQAEIKELRREFLDNPNMSLMEYYHREYEIKKSYDMVKPNDYLDRMRKNGAI